MGEAMTASVGYRRIYADPEAGEGRRVLVDRVWPRGIRRDAGRFDEWLPDIAPSTELRKWYGHDPSRFDEFRKRYLEELDRPDRAPARRRLRDLAGSGNVMLVTATRDIEHSQAAVLAAWLNANGRSE
jgi:uncharacterized protein YeaO (DUF488 family)